MNHSQRCSILLGVALIACAVVAAPFAGAPPFDLSWNTIDGGGGASFGGEYELLGTIGQADACAQPAVGGEYALAGGIWPASDSGAPPCLADLNGNGHVDGADLGLLLADWGLCRACEADLNGDGNVNGADLGLLLAGWGPCP